MPVSVNREVQQSLLQELNLVMRHYYHQSIDDVVNDLRCRIKQIPNTSDPSVILREVYSSGLLYQQSDKIFSQLRKALSRFVHGTYGLCANCGCEIPNDYLATKPTSDLCPSCVDLRFSSLLMHQHAYG